MITPTQREDSNISSSVEHIDNFRVWSSALCDVLLYFLHSNGILDPQNPPFSPWTEAGENIPKRYHFLGSDLIGRIDLNYSFNAFYWVGTSTTTWEEGSPKISNSWFVCKFHERNGSSFDQTSFCKHRPNINFSRWSGLQAKDSISNEKFSLKTDGVLFDERLAPKDEDAKYADFWQIENIWDAIAEKVRGENSELNLI